MASFKIFILVSLTGILLACPAIGQVAKPQTLTPTDYDLWSTMRLASASKDGKFISYHLDYPSGLDTLFIMTAKGERLFSIPKGNRGEFHGSQFICLMPGNILSICDLSCGSIRDVQNVEDFELLSDGKLLLLKNERNTIEIVNDDGHTIQHLEKVGGFAISPGKDKIVAIINDQLNSKVILISKGARQLSEIKQSGTATFTNLSWDDDGGRIAFAAKRNEIEDATIELLMYSVKTKTVVKKVLPAEKAKFSIIEIKVSPDGNRVAIYTRTTNLKGPDKPIPEVWNSADAIPFSSQKSYSKTNIWVWFTNTNLFSEVTGANLTRGKLSPDLRFGVLLNPMANRPSFKPEADRDLFVKNLSTGTTIPFLSKFSGQAERLVLSPDGTGICFFDADNWFFYDFRTQQRKNLTAGLGVIFGDEDNDRPEPNRPYALPIWSVDGKTIYIYDKFDIWAFDRGSRRRLTNGRERSLIFRFAQVDFYNPDSVVSRGVTVDNKKSLFLSVLANDYSFSGYATLSNTGVTQVLLTNKRTSQLQTSEDGNRIFWTEEDFDESPKIMKLDRSTAKTTPLFASNPQQQNYNWGKSKLIYYKDGFGRMLNATLLYPVGYNPAKTYPMVVHVYEKQPSSLHSYINPSLTERDGFNSTNLTSQGYFVLFPDIVFTIGKPGDSALKCTENAVRQASIIASIDTARIGIIGHSMGGYIVNFIVTHSSMFKAAVSGASVADTVGFYLSMGSNTGIPDASRFEYEQYRIGKSFFDDPEAYRRNSPIEFAAKMNSALLLWTGANDTQVKPWQSMEFHMALSRLGKNSELLIYPGEDHSLDLEKNRVDLTLRIEDWFRRYLRP